jgi:hypothetical protein
LKFTLQGITTHDNQVILTFSSSSPIILNIEGYQTEPLNTIDTTYFKVILHTEIEFITVFKNNCIDIKKDINNNIFNISKSQTKFLYYIEMFGEDDIIYSSYFTITQI